MTAPLRLRLPATSANLGPGFDAAAVALDFFLEIEAVPAPEFSIAASGRDAERTSHIENNLILGIYERLLRENGKPVTPLAIRMHNEIPLGMGCGSSAAGRLAAIALAVHFGLLGWTSAQVLEEASALEGHPDNAASCWLGGFITAAAEGRAVRFARVIPPVNWRAIVVLPADPLATSKARAVLPAAYSRADAVANVQSASLLGLAFAQGRGELLRIAMRDRFHQPYRASMCPLLPPLLPLAGSPGILGVALSGAGPAVLVIVEDEQSLASAAASIRAALAGLPEPELKMCSFQADGAESLASHEPVDAS
ncbi:MAG: homoserine kinase [Acidobacteriota bacterium]|nr:homoserine kinase [Acidobacteriota bacterium]